MSTLVAALTLSLLPLLTAPFAIAGVMGVSSMSDCQRERYMPGPRVVEEVPVEMLRITDLMLCDEEAERVER